MEKDILNTLVKEYKTKREKLLQEAMEFKFGTMKFSSDEQKANDVFEKIRIQTVQKLPEQFHFQALKSRDQVESSQLYSILSDIPKGSLHHIHISFYLPSKWFVQNCLEPTAYIDDTGKIAFFENPPSGLWRNILKLREDSSNKEEYDKNLENSFHLTEEEMNSSNVWIPFQFKINNRLAICYREGYWKKYILETCYYAIQEGFNNLQIRTYVPNNEEKKFIATDEIEIYKECEKEAKLRDPNFSIGIIFVGLRFWSSEKIQAMLKTAREIKKKHPDLIIGYDLVAEEKLMEAVEFANPFLEHAQMAANEGFELPPILHGGETLDKDNTNLYDLYMFKSKRIGHGINLFKHPYLYSKLKEADVCIEVNPLSNQILKYIADLRLHPAIGYHNYGIRISLSCDDPGLFQTNTIWDFFAACISFEFNLLDLKRVIMNSIETSCMDSIIQNTMLKDWEQKWDTFIKNIIEKYN